MDPTDVLNALRPRTLRERVRARLVGGWSAVQVRERLAEPVAAAWFIEHPGEPVVQARRLVDAVRSTLLTLTNEGKVERRASSYGVELRSKGGRAVVVDVFRLT